jgi:hypothetical protein
MGVLGVGCLRVLTTRTGREASERNADGVDQARLRYLGCNALVLESSEGLTEYHIVPER